MLSILIHAELIEYHTGNLSTGDILYLSTIYVNPVDGAPLEIPHTPPPHWKGEIDVVQRNIQVARGSKQDCFVCWLLIIVLRVYGHNSRVHVIVVRYIGIVDVCGGYFSFVATGI